MPLPHPASYRDPAGFVFRHSDGLIYRLVQPAYAPHYEQLISSGLYERLSAKGHMLAHEEVAEPAIAGAYKILKPTQLQAWSYAPEWSFAQLQAAALHTLSLCLSALDAGMILKDAPGTNIQFVNGRPVLIDSLSFELYEAGKPWAAFRQFCGHFLYPLLLAAHLPAYNPAMLLAWPDGLSASLTAQMLPRKLRWKLNYQLYLYLPARMEGRRGAGSRQPAVSPEHIRRNLMQLQGFIKGLKPAASQSEWHDYYTGTILSEGYLQHKQQVVAAMLHRIKPATVVDAGCNTGAFSMLAARHAHMVWALDTDPLCVDMLYRQLSKTDTPILPLLADLCNPTPATGWDNAERPALLSRARGELVMALAVIHHLALGRNVPLAMILKTLSAMSSRYLIIEFVPKTDPKSQILLQSKPDIYTGYGQAQLEALLEQDFTILEAVPLAESERMLYLAERR